MGHYWLMSQTPLDRIVSHMGDVQGPLRDRAVKVGADADANLNSARASTTHHDLAGAEVGRFSINVAHGEVDHYISLEGPNPMAVEFGHFPSGHFAPERYGKVTKAPAGLYILTRAGIENGAEGAGKHHVPSGEATPHGPQTHSREIGKR